METTRLGHILVESGLLTESELEECLATQKEGGHRQPLGELLLEQKRIDESTLHGILSVQKRCIGLDSAQSQIPVEEMQQRLAEGTIPQFLSVARELGASDLILASEDVPRLRLHGSLVDLPVPALTRGELQSALFALLTTGQVAAYYRQRSLDLTVSLGSLGRHRMTIFRHLRGIAGTFHPVATEAPRLRSLGLPGVVRRFPRYRHGLVLVAGPLGCGKTSTVAALVNEINQDQPRHIVTIEPHVGLVHPSGAAMISQVELTSSGLSTREAFQAALRQDPDVIVLGNLVDPEVTVMALMAAQAGRLVIATVHTRSAEQTLLRLLDQFPPERRAQVRSMLTHALQAILCQQLVPHRTGRGLSVACEVLLMNDAVRTLVREDRISQIPMALQMGRSDGMRAMDDSLRDLVEKKLVSLEEAFTRATFKEEFLREQRSLSHA